MAACPARAVRRGVTAVPILLALALQTTPRDTAPLRLVEFMPDDPAWSAAALGEPSIRIFTGQGVATIWLLRSHDSAFVVARISDSTYYWGDDLVISLDVSGNQGPAPGHDDFQWYFRRALDSSVIYRGRAGRWEAPRGDPDWRLGASREGGGWTVSGQSDDGGGRSCCDWMRLGWRERRAGGLVSHSESTTTVREGGSPGPLRRLGGSLRVSNGFPTSGELSGSRVRRGGRQCVLNTEAQRPRRIRRRSVPKTHHEGTKSTKDTKKKQEKKNRWAPSPFMSSVACASVFNTALTPQHGLQPEPKPRAQRPVVRRLRVHVHRRRLTRVELSDVVLRHQLKPEARSQRHVHARAHVVRKVVDLVATGATSISCRIAPAPAWTKGLIPPAPPALSGTLSRSAAS